MNKLKKLTSILIFNFLLAAAMPGFSILRAQAIQPQRFIVDFRTLPAGLKADPAILKITPIFSAPAPKQFQNIFKIDTTYSAAALQQIYGSAVVYIHPDNQLEAGTVSINDPGFSADPANADREWGLLKSHYPEAWNKTTGSQAVIVAVIDTGIDGTHEDLSAGQVVAGFDFTTQAAIPAGSDSDVNGHGTLIAGVIGATPNNFRGIVGTNWNIKMMPLKALDASGAGESADVAAAIVYAADHGANIINMSLGGVGFAHDTTLSDAITYAFNKGLVIIAAAGNDVASSGGDLDLNPVFPICDDNGQNMVIGVAATDINDQKAQFSNYGKNCVDVSAPGKRILSTINRDPLSHLPAPSSYAYASGTSLAAPFVSGEAALIKALYPQISNQEIRDRIINSADPIDQLNPTQCGGTSCAGDLGKGRINAFVALDPNLAASISDGSLVQSATTGQAYLVSGGQKHPVSAFVLGQRFNAAAPRTVPDYVLDPIPGGAYATPLDGTLVKSPQDPTVYEIISGFKRPITLQIWKQRAFQPAQINILSSQEVSSWVTGTFLPPIEGTLVRARTSRTIYWVIDGLLHPMNRGFFLSRGLSGFPIMVLNGNDLAGYARGSAYIR